jgi:hypothetical protein
LPHLSLTDGVEEQLCSDFQKRRIAQIVDDRQLISGKSPLEAPLALFFVDFN